MDPREIQQLEDLCVQDDAPFCQAACPLHVDARSMLAAIVQGDFALGARLYSKKVPFPGILSRICDQPCRVVCKRAEVGDAINIGLLERSCADYAGFTPGAPGHGSPKPQTVAITGGGLSGLSAALELAKKHYGVTLFEASNRLGGRLRLMPADLLPPEVIDEELGHLMQANVDVRTSIHVGHDITVEELAEQYDAVYLAVGDARPENGVRAGDIVARGIDPVSLATSQEAVFAGGSLRRVTELGFASGSYCYSPVWSVSDGCRAAISIDRFLKGESLTSSREKEGPYQSRLFTSLQGVEPLGAVSPHTPELGFRRQEAIAEAARCLQCQCLECVKACTYLDHFDEYPGKCIRKVTKNIASHPGKSYRTHTKFINACSLCGLCGTVCPTDLNMAVVNSEARGVMWDRGYMPPAIHDFAVRDMESSNTDPGAMARNQPGYDSSSYLFFPGCQLAASAPGNVEQTYRHLTEKLSGGVGLMLGCCGAPAAWAGRRELFHKVVDAFTRQWSEMKQPQVILACPTCSLMFKESLPLVPAISLWEILDREGLPADAPPSRGEVLALHDSCTARSAPEIQDSVRSIAQRLGYEIEELPYSREMTKCCGYGGLMYLVNRELTDKVIKSRVDESATDYLTYCANCRDFFADQGKPSYHLLDLIFDGYRADPARPGPTLSERRDNRRLLAGRMLAELWGETMSEQHEHAKVKLRISPDVAAKMEKDYILVDDVQRVVYQAEKTGNKLQVAATDRFIAHYRPSLVTYWVEYSMSGDEYEVFNAYSHRMRIVQDVSGDES